MKETNNKTNTENATIDALFSAGAHFGFVKSRRHPSAKPYIFGIKNKIEIFDLEKTSEALAKALSFVEELGSKNAKILFIGGKNEAQQLLQLQPKVLTCLSLLDVLSEELLRTFQKFEKEVRS